jgi:hypothetical protein
MIRSLKLLGVVVAAAFAMSAVAASGAQAFTQFTCTSEPTCIAKFSQDPTEPKQTFETHAGRLVCSEFSGHGMGTSGESEITIESPAYNECESEETELSASVNFGTCDYVAFANGEVELNPSTCTVTITGGGGCTTTVPGGQRFSSSGTAAPFNKPLTFTNVETGGIMEVTIHVHATGIHYSTSSNCPGGGGSFTNGTYIGKVTAQGYKTPTPGTVRTGLTVS